MVKYYYYFKIYTTQKNEKHTKDRQTGDKQNTNAKKTSNKII